MAIGKITALNAARFLMLQMSKTNFKAAIEATPSLIEMQDTRGMTLLHFAAHLADWEAIQILIENGADPFQINSLSQKKSTLLNYAALNGPAFVIALTIWLNTCFNKNLVPLLTTVLPQINFIETFSDINVRDFASILMQVLQKLYPSKNTLLAQLRNELIDNALTFHLIAISKQMRPAIETEEEKDLVSAYFLMIQTNKTNFKRAIAAIPSLTGLQDTRGMTLLHNAARQADWEAIKILIENGANPFQINNFSPKSLTILNYAAMNNGPAFVIALAIWLKTCFNQNLVPLLTSVLPQMNFIETFSPINARNFTSILLQVLQQMYPEETAFLINVRNQYIGKGLAYHLIELSRQMQPKMAIQSNTVMLDPSSPILNHPKSPESPDASNGLDSARFLR